MGMRVGMEERKHASIHFSRPGEPFPRQTDLPGKGNDLLFLFSRFERLQGGQGN